MGFCCHANAFAMNASQALAPHLVADSGREKAATGMLCLGPLQWCVHMDCVHEALSVGNERIGIV